MKPELIPPTTVSGLRRALLEHYDRTARELPWRRDTDPYRVLVSEIMLQQTRVETVTRYYEPWLQRFPTIEALAEADEDQVLKAWEGLGYYRRARNLHAAARVVRERHQGTIPSDPARLRALPGVGEYTTGAVASIAFGLPLPAVDGNVRRVFARLFDVAAPTPAWSRQVAALLVTEDRPGDWTQALMELGATICRPRSPSCNECPVRAWCVANERGTVAKRPAPRKKRAVPRRVVGLAVLHSEEAVLLVRRPDGGLLAGMWAFPELGEAPGAVAGPTDGTPGREVPAEMTARIHEAARHVGLEPIGGCRRLPEVDHRFTHLHVRYVPFSMEVGEVAIRGPVADSDDVRWVGAGELARTALPVAQRKVYESWLSRAECS